MTTIHDTHDDDLRAQHDERPGGEAAAGDEHRGHTGPAGHGGGHGDHVAVFRRRFWWSLLLTVPIVATSHMVMDWFGYELDVPGRSWIGPVLGTVVYLWAGWPFLSGGLAEARARRPGMMLLIAMAITVAYAASASYSAGWFTQEFWWELAALITIMLLGHWQEMKALGQASDALAALAALLPDEADRVRPDGTVEAVSLDELTAGDLVLVRPGARVPADGEIVDGSAELDEAMITGESRPVPKGVGDRVVAGTVSTDSSIRVRVDAVGEDTSLAGIRRLVDEAQRSGSRAQALADRAAAMLFAVAVAAAAITFVAWAAVGRMDTAVLLTVGVLVISCPHALGLATPLVNSVSASLAARNGILVKSRIGLERMRTVDAVLFDKTGTLTKGEHVVVGSAMADGEDEAAAWRAAGAVEADSEHPLARAIVRAARRAGSPACSHRVHVVDRGGVEATVEGTAYAVGGPALLRERHLREPRELEAAVEGWRRRGAAVLYLVRDDAVVAAFALEDEVRPEARQAVAELRASGRRVIVITGDARQVADAVGAELGVDEVLAEVLPEDKDAEVARLQAARPVGRPWSATGSTTPPPSPGPTSASPSAPAPTWPSSRPGSSSPAPTPGRS
jgi:Cu2+-exporting ATPase